MLLCNAQHGALGEGAQQHLDHKRFKSGRAGEEKQWKKIKHWEVRRAHLLMGFQK